MLCLDHPCSDFALHILLFTCCPSMDSRASASDTQEFPHFKIPRNSYWLLKWNSHPVWQISHFQLTLSTNELQIPLDIKTLTIENVPHYFLPWFLSLCSSHSLFHFFSCFMINKHILIFHLKKWNSWLSVLFRSLSMIYIENLYRKLKIKVYYLLFCCYNIIPSQKQLGKKSHLLAQRDRIHQSRKAWQQE